MQPSPTQSARGSGITQISVAASSNVNINVNGRQVLHLHAPAFPKPLPTENPQELDLLKAAHATVEFTGRDAIFQNFLDWCLDGTRPLSMRTLVGPGGAGKTRFAHELYAHLRKQEGWTAYFLKSIGADIAVADIWSEIPSKKTLIIVDYPSDFGDSLAAFLSPLPETLPSDRHVRVLLLARTASWDQGWLAPLASGRDGGEIDRHFHPREPMDFPPLTALDRQRIFSRATAITAEFNGKPVPQVPALAEFEKKDVAERLADPLTLMMAAVTSVHDGPASAALLLNRTELAFEVAQTLVANRMKDSVKDHAALFLHMAAYATLCGGLDEDQALLALETETRETHLGSVPDPLVFLTKLQAWLPGESLPAPEKGAAATKTWIGRIQPDIVGEAFVLGSGKVRYLRSPGSAVLRAAETNAGRTIRTLVRIIQDFSHSPATARPEPLLWLAELVEKGEAVSDLLLLAELSDSMPQSTVVLRRIGLRISVAICDRMRTILESAGGSDRSVQAFLALSLNNLAIRQNAVGLRADALKTAQEAADLYRELAKHNRDAFLPNLAASLNNLATMQSEVGLRAVALESGQEAVDLYRELAKQNRDAFLPDLAMSLNNLANRQSDVGLRAVALESAQEAVDLRRELAKQNRDAFLPDLAMSLNNLATMQSEVGLRAVALESAQEAVDLRRELAKHNRDAFLPDLAMSLNNLANRQSEVGLRADALETAQEAADLYRELAKQNRDAFLPVLAMSLNNLATMQSEVGLRADALKTAQEAVDLYRELAKQNRDAFLPGLAISLNNLANRQSDVGLRAVALESAQEAVDLRRELAQQNRDAFLPGLATSLNNLANRQSEVGLRAEALETAQEAVDSYRELAKQNREAYLPDLAMSLNNLATMQSEVGLRAAALKTAQEAVDSYRELAKQNREAYLPNLAASLNTLANRQSEVGLPADALKTAQEASGYFEELAQRNRDAFCENRARSQWTLANVLIALDRNQEAAQVFEQAIGELLPQVPKNPQISAALCAGLARGYMSILTAAGLELNEALMNNAAIALTPYLKEENS